MRKYVLKRNKHQSFIFCFCSSCHKFSTDDQFIVINWAVHASKSLKSFPLFPQLVAVSVVLNVLERTNSIILLSKHTPKIHESGLKGVEQMCEKWKKNFSIKYSGFDLIFQLNRIIGESLVPGQLINTDRLTSDEYLSNDRRRQFRGSVAETFFMVLQKLPHRGLPPITSWVAVLNLNY